MGAVQKTAPGQTRGFKSLPWSKTLEKAALFSATERKLRSDLITTPTKRCCDQPMGKKKA